jgi:mercuric transport protein
LTPYLCTVGIIGLMKSWLALPLLVSLSCAASAEPKSATLHVERIYCAACAAQVKKALNSVPGVSAVAVEVERKEVVVKFDSAKATPRDLMEATAKRGFPATIRKVEP